MSQTTKREIMRKLRRRYQAAGKEHKTKLINQAVALLGYHRKAAIRALGGEAAVRIGVPAIIGRPREYEPERLLPVLKTIWLAGQQPCGRRLAGMMPEWVPAYEAYHRKLPAEVRERLVEASSATLDRLLQPARAQCGARPGGTRPGNMLRQEIPIRGGSWQESQPGWMEVDTVALCGGSLAGEHVWALDNVDICTDWLEIGAMFGRGQHGTVAGLSAMEKRLPFGWLGLDSDNGGEFMNYHVLGWCQKGRAEPIYYTRSRPYRSNDNAHVEQKNWTQVRHWFGYERYDNAEVVGLINELAGGELGQFINLFSPSLKLERKEQRANGKEKRVYGKAVTACTRVLANAHVGAEKKQELMELKSKLNPFDLEKRIQKKMREIERLRRALE